MIDIPQANAEAIARRFPDGAEFLATLPSRLDEIAQRWQLTLLDSLPIGIGGFLIGVRTADRREAVLKLSPVCAPQSRVNQLEAYALRRWRGRDAPVLLQADPAVGALVLERCRPGATIDGLSDDDMLQEGCELAARLHRRPDAVDVEVLSRADAEVAQRAERTDALMAQLGHPFPPRIEQAIASHHRALASEHHGPLVVCHGDLNPGNVLSHADGWVAVDPLPVIAEPAYDAVSLVWSKRAWLLDASHPRRIVRRRLEVAAEALATDVERVRMWTLVRLTGLLADRLSWGGYDEAPFIAFAELLDD